MTGVTITLNMAAVKERLQGAAQRAVADTAMAALKDCNYYCKQDQGGLINSSLIHTELASEMLPIEDKETAALVAQSPGSDLKNGILRWKMPYARRQYYLDAVRKNLNPNARKMWAHHAASVHGAEWLLRMQTAFTKYAKER